MPKAKNKKVIGLVKVKLGGKIIIQCVGFRAKTGSYLIDDGSEDKKAKSTKNCVIEIKINFENYKNCLEATQLDNQINYLKENEINVHSLKKDHKEFRKKQ